MAKVLFVYVFVKCILAETNRWIIFFTDNAVVFHKNMVAAYYKHFHTPAMLEKDSSKIVDGKEEVKFTKTNIPFNQNHNLSLVLSKATFFLNLTTGCTDVNPTLCCDSCVLCVPSI